MKNITLKVDDETYSKARVLAAKRGTSISALVRDFLVKETSGTESEEEAHRRYVAALEKLYAEADARATPRSAPLIPPTREQIYEERLR